MISASKSPPRQPREVFRHRDFRLFAATRLLAIVGWQMQSVAIGWQVYALTHSAMSLGYVGLAQFLPIAVFSPLTGNIADRFDRRQIVRLCQATLVACSLILAWISWSGSVRIEWIYLLLFAVGTARAFQAPASQSLLPLVVPAEHFANAVAWNSSLFMFATLFGPSLGGFCYAAWGPTSVYLGSSLLTLGAFFTITSVRARSGKAESEVISWRTALAGIHYIVEQKIILGCVTLDLFAVLLGGAEALLPVFASDILHVGPRGLGMLRGAPAVGALVMGVAIAHLPPMRRAGATMLWCVAGFGLSTILFGLSRNFPFSLACLAVLGGLDMVSVIVRQTLVQTLTPKEKLGRVNAINMVFVGASNELGEFESGFTAALLGAVPAVVIGGFGTLAVVAIWAWRFPSLRRIDRLDRSGLQPGPAEIEATGGSEAAS